MKFSDWYREGERVLGGASPLDYLAEGGYCEPISGGGPLAYLAGWRGYDDLDDFPPEPTP